MTARAARQSLRDKAPKDLCIEVLEDFDRAMRTGMLVAVAHAWCVQEWLL